MAKKRRSESEEVVNLIPQLENKIRLKQKKFKFSPKQVHLLDLLLDPKNSVILISGVAGTSKSYLAIYAAIQLMVQDSEKDLLYVRSIAESADKGLGSLPGDIAEKFDPFLIPLYDKLDEIIYPQDKIFLKDNGKIAAIPVNFLRGSNWINKIVVADECQNFTLKELTTMLTRIGEGSKLILCGDFMQSDINGKSGYKALFHLFNNEESKDNGVQTFSFTKDDIVRSGILKFLIEKLETLGASV